MVVNQEGQHIKQDEFYKNAKKEVAPVLKLSTDCAKYYDKTSKNKSI